MSKKTIISVERNKPIRIKGDFVIVDRENNVLFDKKVISLCSCGLSKKSPFCDGSHKEIDND